MYSRKREFYSKIRQTIVPAEKEEVDFNTICDSKDNDTQHSSLNLQYNCPQSELDDITSYNNESLTSADSEAFSERIDPASICDEPLWKLGRHKSKIGVSEFCRKLVCLQTAFKASDKLMNAFLTLCKSISPSFNQIPKSFKTARSVIRENNISTTHQSTVLYYCVTCRKNTGKHIILLIKSIMN